MLFASTAKYTHTLTRHFPHIPCPFRNIHEVIPLTGEADHVSPCGEGVLATVYIIVHPQFTLPIYGIMNSVSFCILLIVTAYLLCGMDFEPLIVHILLTLHSTLSAQGVCVNDICSEQHYLFCCVGFELLCLYTTAHSTHCPLRACANMHPFFVLVIHAATHIQSVT